MVALELVFVCRHYVLDVLLIENKEDLNSDLWFLTSTFTTKVRNNSIIVNYVQFP
jgi:hypothetical protein